MTSIRPLERRDIAEVASLYESVVRSGSRTSAPELVRYFERTLLDHPWVDPQVPSLVYETTHGAIAGFIGSHVRRLRMGDTALRVSYGGQLVSDPAVRNRGVGALLVRSFLNGPQDLTLTDGATPDVRQIFERLGGATAFLASINWTRFFRPARFAGEFLLQRRGDSRWKPLIAPLARPLDAIARKVAPTFLRPAPPSTGDEVLTPRLLVDELRKLAGDQLHVAYDEEFLGWVFDEMARVQTRGELVHRLVRDAHGEALGGYVAYFKRGGAGEVLWLDARPRRVGAVMDHLFLHAWRKGAALLQGRLEAPLFEAVASRGCYLRHSARVLVHSHRHPELVQALSTGAGRLSRMDGEWWMGHHIEPFGSATTR